ncbi:hypothetical protein ABPG72_005297 [Tetrahymena utriculariae]
MIQVKSNAFNIALGPVRSESVSQFYCLTMVRCYVFSRKAQNELLAQLVGCHILVLVELEDQIFISSEIGGGASYSQQGQDQQPAQPCVQFQLFEWTHLDQNANQLLLMQSLEHSRYILGDLIYCDQEYSRIYLYYNLLTTNCQFYCLNVLAYFRFEDTAVESVQVISFLPTCKLVLIRLIAQINFQKLHIYAEAWMTYRLGVWSEDISPKYK